ncbi:hypothetical protein JXM83_01780 [Candidatus Woesearchaeota archaeon]|nr:hypothetical protein [Candidatus Woesearchaeota archaeon]
MTKDKELRKIYPVNKRTNAYVIKVSVKSYNDIFNEWDDSIIEKRDLNPSLREYLEECSEEIPLKNKIEIYVTIHEKKSKNKEKYVRDGFKNYFKFFQYFVKKDYKTHRAKAINSCINGSLMLLLATLGEQFSEVLPLKLLIEGIFVGGWVLLWQTFEILFFEASKIKKELNTYERFSKSKIIFGYRKPIIVD